MSPIVFQIIMGWPAILGSLLVSGIGIIRGRPAIPVAGAVLTLGFAWYLRAWPSVIFDVLGYSLPLLHLAAAWAIHRRKSWIAWAVLLPHGCIAVYLGMAVLSSAR